MSARLPWPLRILWGVVVMFAVICFIIWAVASFALNQYIKDQAEARLSQDLGQKVTIGHLRLGLEPLRPSVAAVNVKVGDDQKNPLYEASRIEGGCPLKEVYENRGRKAERFFGAISGLKISGKPWGDYEGDITEPAGLRYVISNLKGDFRGAKVTGEGQEDLNHRWKADIAADNLDYSVFAAGVKDGKARLSLRLQGSDETQRDIITHLSGRATLVGGKGMVEGRTLNLWAGSLLTAFLPGGGDAHLTCAVADFEITNGVAHSRTVIIDTDKATITGKGTVDLVRQHVDMVFTPRTKGLGAVVSLATPMVVSGSFENLSSRPQATGMAKKVGGFLLSAIAPPMALLPLLENSGDGNPCQKFLERKAQ